MNDLRFAFRQLAKHPGFTAVAVLTLALGIGANTAIFSVVNSVLIHSLPYLDPEQLVYVQESGTDGRPNGRNSGGAYKDWRDHSTTFSALAIYEDVRRNLTGRGTPEHVKGLMVSTEFLSVLKLVPMLGRDFTVAEGRGGGDHRVLLLTHSFWQSHFGGDPAIVGTVVSLDQVPHTIIGVLPPRALMQDEVQLLLPEVVDEPGVNWGRSGHWREVVGRLRAGATLVEAQTELRAIKERLNSEYPSWKAKWSVMVFPLQDQLTAANRPRLLLLLGAVALVLLIACANVSNLLLARGSARSREMAIRAALGAHPSRIVRQVLTESVLLALAGCGLGLLFAALGMRLLTRLVAEDIPRALHPQLDIPVLLFSVIAACGCGVLFGLLPAWRASRSDVNLALKASERGTTSRTKRRSQSLLIMSEYAFTLVLLIGAGLFLRSFVRLLETDPGFNPRHTLAFDLSLPKAKYPNEPDRLRFTKEVISRVKALPGVESVGSICALPLSREDWSEGVSRPDRPTPPNQTTPGLSTVDEGYLPTAGIALRRGRFLTEADNRPDAPPVMVIDAGVAREFFPGEDPLGRRLSLLDRSCEVVGVVSPVHHRDMEHDPRPRVYVAQALFPKSFSDPRYSIIVRSKLPASTLAHTLRETVLGVDPDQPLANVRSLEQDFDRDLAPRRASLILVSLFAAAAVGLACIGIYGVVAHTVGQRTRELCIRSALGAQRGDILALVFQGGMLPSLAGMGLGLIAALALARLVESQLYHVQARDPVVFVASVCLLGLMAAFAIGIPARRATKVDPMVALRQE